MARSPTRSFRLGAHLVEPERGVVRGPTGEIHIDARAMHLLVRLADNSGQLVERKELIGQIWDGAPGGDASLTAAVSHLRQALADDRASPRFIETRRHKGYRLLVTPEPVERRADAGEGKIGNAVVDLARIFHVTENPALAGVGSWRPRLTSFLVNLRKRKLVQWSFAYLAAVWAILQALDLVADSYAWPQLVMRLSFELAALGFAAMLVLAWYHGERGAQRATGMEIMILALLLGIGGSLLLRSSMLRDSLAIARNPVAADAGASKASAGAEARGLAKTVVAVLPFRESGPRGRDEFLGEGLAVELIDRLARVRGLAAMASTSSFSFAGDQTDIPTIAKRLGAGLVVAGEITAAETRIRVKLRLMDAAGREILVQSYDRGRGDILALQSEITTDVVNGLRPQLGDVTVELDEPAGMTTNNEAYLAYLRAQHYMAGTSEADLRQGLIFLLKAVALDPKFAHAYERLAVAYRAMAESSRDNAHATELELLSLRMAKQALSLDSKLAEAYLINGAGDGDRNMEKSHQWQTLAEIYAHTIDMEPNNQSLRLWHAAFLRDIGYLNEATWEAAVAARLDPLNPVVNHELGWAYYTLGQTVPARQHALYSMGQRAGDHYLLAARIEMEKKDYDAARTLLAAAVDSGSEKAGWMQVTLDAMVWPVRKRATLEQLDAALAARSGRIDPFTAFCSYAYLGEPERAVAALRQALDPGYQGAPEYFQMWAPAFSSVRATRAFHDLVEQIGLAEYWRSHGWPDYCKPDGGDFRCF